MRKTLVVAAAAGVVVAMFASASSAQGPTASVRRPDAASPLFRQAIAAQRSHALAWRTAPGIVGSGLGITSSGQPVIEVFTTRSGVSVPRTLGSVRVQSVVTGMIVARSATLRYPRPVPIGVSTGLADFATGTLGARVSNGSAVYALSNNHVFAGVNMANIGDPILQPGPVEDGGTDPADRIGTLSDYQAINFSGNNTMDAAIALTTTGDVGTSTLSDGYGTPSSTTVPASVGTPVQKYGRTTGFTTGSINAVNVDVDVCYFPLSETVCFPGYEAHFVNQFSVPDGSVPFSASGDSGSLLVTAGSNNPVGLLFAGGDGLTIANPIGPVLQRFNVTIDGAASTDGPPGAPTALSALAGDASATLSWTAPSFDGGSPVSGYKVYRDTSPNPTTAVATLGAQTTYADSGLQNGTTYYYKVSALNANGESPLSSQASATPSGLVPPVEPLPTVDAFNRTENPLSDAGRWTNGINGSVETGLYTTSNTLACSKTTTCTAWRNAAQYGPDVEVWARLSTLPGVNNQLRLLARIQQPGTSTYDGYMLRPNQLAGTDQVLIERVDNGVIVNLLTVDQELAAGDVFLLRVKGSTVEAWRNDGSGWSRLGTTTDSTYPGVGFVGVGMRGTTGRADDFGARSLSQNPPGAPTALSALAGDASATLSWTAPSFDGGSPVSGYKVYRDTSPNPTTAVATLGAQTTYADSGLQNGTTYYYKVSALNANGESPLSSQASATPSGLVPPVEPLPTVDAFNRTENPLSDAGRWTNGINGSVETGLYTTSNTLACSKTTTCTAWRNAAQYGPDVEVWARLSTLPGVNNQLRLLARIQQPGTSTYDGYMLRPNQLAGTDQVLIERVDNGVIVNLLTVDQELAAGDVFLLRVKGSTVEAWRNDGSGWSRLGTTTDSTYPGVGFVGVGMRGTTGRADDFGARTIGALPATAPSAPQSLSATAGNAQVSLSWSAPSSNGGSALTTYTVYRSTTSGVLGSALSPSPGLSMNYTDTTAVNGTAYYYVVKASNAIGESPASNEASATPSAPATAPSAPQSLSATAGNAQVSLSWSAPSSNGGSALTTYTVYRSTTSGVLGSALSPSPGLSMNYTDTTAVNGTAYYYVVKASNAIGESPASNEASATPSAPATAPSAPQSLSATAGNAQVSLSWSAPSSNGGSALTTYTVYRSTTSGVLGSALSPSPGLSMNYTDTTAVNGTAYYYVVKASNAIGESPASNEASATPSAPATAPSAPQSLSATAGNAQVSLSWSAPSSNGGSALTTYTVYRSTTSGVLGSALSPSPGLSMNYTDTTAVNGTAYYYVVKASNAIGESPASNEASATPTDLVVPIEPLSILDTFNRANENPLSFAGRWGNGILGSPERSLKVVSNQCASDRNTTATAWWKTLLGADQEVYATMSTLPGNGNAFRLYARLQTPGSSSVDGYMLLYTQASGTDQATIYRITNGALTQLVTANREIGAGARLLFRAKDAALEAWVREGSTWSRIARVTDSAYTGSGYAGIGIRDKTGRLDDFGAR